MTDKKIDEILDEHAARRRALLKNAGKVAITAPAASLLLAKGVKPALAGSYGGKVTTTTPVPSDIRLKKAITRVGTTVLGLPLYRFEYKSKSGVFSGVMAQDVLTIAPEAVSTAPDGFYQVDYGMLGIAMRRLG